MDELQNAKLALDEVRLLYQKHDADSNHIDNKAGSILTGASLILTLFGVLQISLSRDIQSLLYKIMLVVLFILFLGMVVLLMRILSPKEFRTVFKEDWEGVEKAILLKETEEEAALQLVSNYLERIQHNKKIIEGKARQLQWLTRLFAAQMVIIVGLSLYAVR
jgi:hypothetical protein